MNEGEVSGAHYEINSPDDRTCHHPTNFEKNQILKLVWGAKHGVQWLITV